MFKPLRVGSAIAAKPTFAIGHRIDTRMNLSFRLLHTDSILGTKPVNDTPINNCGQKIQRT